MSVIPEFRRRKFFNTTAQAPTNDHALSEVMHVANQANERTGRAKLGLADSVMNLGNTISNGLSKVGDSVFDAGYRIKEAKYQKQQDELRAQERAARLAEAAQEKADRLAERARQEEEKKQDVFDRLGASSLAMQTSVDLHAKLQELNANMGLAHEFSDTAPRIIKEELEAADKACTNDNMRMHFAPMKINMMENLLNSANVMTDAKKIDNATQQFNDAKRSLISEAAKIQVNTEVGITDYLQLSAQSGMRLAASLSGFAKEGEIDRQREEIFSGISENAFRQVKSVDAVLAREMLVKGKFTEVTLPGASKPFSLVTDKKKIESWIEETDRDIARNEQNVRKTAYGDACGVMAKMYTEVTGEQADGEKINSEPELKAQLYNAAVQTGDQKMVASVVSSLERIGKVDPDAHNKISAQAEKDINDSFDMLRAKGMVIQKDKSSGKSQPATGLVTLDDLAGHQMLVMNAFAQGQISGERMKSFLNDIQPWYGKMNSQVGETPGVMWDSWYSNEALTRSWVKRRANEVYDPRIQTNLIPNNRAMELCSQKIVQAKNANGGNDLTEKQMEEIKNSIFPDVTATLNQRTNKLNQKGS